MSLQVANTIRDQLGGRAFVMMGAKDLVGSEDSLRWKIGRNAKGVNMVEVKLAPDDTYTVRFIRARRSRGVLEHQTVSEVDMVYVDSLRETIEHNTGLYLSL